MPLRTDTQGLLIALGFTFLLAACAGQQAAHTPNVFSDTPESAAATDAQWIETDAVVSVDNHALASHIRTALMARDPADPFIFHEVSLDFTGASAPLTIYASVDAGDDGLIGVRLRGEIVFSYSGAGLSWFPWLLEIQPHVTVDGFEGDDWLRRIRTALVVAFVISRNNRLGLEFAPPGTITLGARLPGFNNTAFEQSFRLSGAFTVAASRHLSNPGATDFALDLEFVEGISYCETDFTISRSTFARRIENREPRGVEPWLDAEWPNWHYFTEVADARRALTLVHYWFADGRPIGATELSVEPSARWRTWSTLPAVPRFSPDVEVFAVDRDSGCIVDARHIRIKPDGPSGMEGPGHFEQITRGYSTGGGQSRLAVIEISRDALAEAFNLATAGRRFAVSLDTGAGFTRPVAGTLQAPDPAQMSCETPDCALQTECRADFSRCQRKQDIRDCTTCLFSNPLNDRCVSERIDTACEDRKAQLNASYASSWEACMAREERSKRDCDLRGQAALQYCQQRAERYRSDCEANARKFANREAPLVRFLGQAHTGGTLSAVYSELRAVKGMEQVKGLLSIEPSLTMTGTLRADPAPDLGSLGDCIVGWDADFQIEIEQPQLPRRLVGNVQSNGEGLAVSWPGLTLPLSAERGPIEAIIAGSRQAGADCALGLTPTQLAELSTGEDGLLLQGVLPLDLQLERSYMALPRVSAAIDGRRFTASADSTGQHIRFELRESDSSSATARN